MLVNFHCIGKLNEFRVYELKEIAPSLLITEFLSLPRPINDERLNLCRSCEGLCEVHLVSTLCKVSYIVLLNINGKRKEFMMRNLKGKKSLMEGSNSEKVIL